jgi:pyruvate-formate lyase-activating enzyme
MGRFEAPAPVSPGCNARCAGCLSLRHGTRTPCPQERIAFVPDPREIIAYAVPHLENAKRAMLSFGQGCEGEPLTQFELVRDAVAGIRKRTSAGTLHMNTNGGMPGLLEKLFDAGLDSIRVSLNSAQEIFYLRHFRPKNFTFNNVRNTVQLAFLKRKYCSINYFVFPGFTDTEEETAAFVTLLKETRPDFVQLRNLNLDPESYLGLLGKEAFTVNGIGMLSWMKRVKRACPWIRFGYYNPPREDWKETVTRD